ncbi:MAG: hypothetical protein ACT4QF_18005 [Sporichthyaceae bacterium]
MSEQPDLESRVTGLEQRMRRVEADAAAARKLSADTDRDVAEFAIKLDANRQAINALAEQTAGGFRAVHGRIDGLEVEMRAGFAEMRAGFAEMRGEMGAGFAAIAQRLDTLIERENGS